MRSILVLLPLLAVAAPVSAQQAAPPEPQSAIIPPAAADKVADALDAATDALLSLKVGRLKATIDGHPPTAAERHMTLRELASAKDPNFERKLHQQIAQARVMARQGTQALDEAIPQVVAGLEQADRAVKRATANLPDPNYPKR